MYATSVHTVSIGVQFPFTRERNYHLCAIANGVAAGSSDRFLWRSGAIDQQNRDAVRQWVSASASGTVDGGAGERQSAVACRTYNRLHRFQRCADSLDRLHGYSVARRLLLRSSCCVLA